MFRHIHNPTEQLRRVILLRSFTNSHSLAQLGENRRWKSLDDSREHTGNRLHATTKLLQFGISIQAFDISQPAAFTPHHFFKYNVYDSHRYSFNLVLYPIFAPQFLPSSHSFYSSSISQEGAQPVRPLRLPRQCHRSPWRSTMFKLSIRIISPRSLPYHTVTNQPIVHRPTVPLHHHQHHRPRLQPRAVFPVPGPD